MKDRYVIYDTLTDGFLSSIGEDSIETSEFPQEYMVFDSPESAQNAIETIVERFGAGREWFEIEVL